jgi:hypothetical protein
MADVDPELLEELIAQPFITVEPGDTVILAIGSHWELEQVHSLGTYLVEWRPDVKWQAIHDAGFTGVIHIKAAPSTTE